MRKAATSKLPVSSVDNWKRLFEAALVEDDPGLLPHRLQNAKDAIVDTIETSFDTASSSDRLLLLAALNTISSLFEANLRRPHGETLGHSA